MTVSAFALGITLVVGASCHAEAQAADQAYALNYFPDHRPSESEIRALAPHGKEIVIARVKVNAVVSLGGRHADPTHGPKNRHSAGVQIVQTAMGKLEAVDEQLLSFAPRNSIGRYMFPATPAMRARMYFIAFYKDETNENQLIGFPVRQEEYENWNREVWAYQGEISKYGTRDR